MDFDYVIVGAGCALDPTQDGPLQCHPVFPRSPIDGEQPPKA